LGQSHLVILYGNNKPELLLHSDIPNGSGRGFGKDARKLCRSLRGWRQGLFNRFAGRGRIIEILLEG